MTAAQLLQELNEGGEQPRIEAKLASGIGTSVLETVCAFANEPGLGGGYLLLGIERADELFGYRYRPNGISDPEKLAEDLVTGAASAFNRPVRVEDVVAEEVEGKIVLRAFVPEAQPGDKPVFFKRKGLPKGAFRRYGSSDVACTDDDLALFYEGRSLVTYDANIVPGATFADISPEALEDYRKAREEVFNDAVELTYSDEDLLLSLNAVQTVNGQLVPTVAGLLLFGSQRALRQFFPMVRVDYIRVPGRQWVEDPDERFSSIDMRGSIMQVVRRAEAAVIDDLPKSFSLSEGDLQRTDVLPIPRRVLREAIVNAVMHRSYREHSPVQIIRYSNRLEIVNPGYSLKPRERLGERRSETRNPVIAAVLHETRFAETKGSGISVMRKLMEREQLVPPTFDSDREGNEFTVRLLLIHFLSHDDHDWLGQFGDLSLTPEEKLALVFVREVGAIDNATYRELVGLDSQRSGQSLRWLREADLLDLKGKGSATYYVAGMRLKESLAGATGSVSAKEELPAKGAVQPGMVSPQSGMVSPQSGMVSPQSGMPAPEDGALPPELMEVVQTLKRRESPVLMRRLVYDLCSWRPMSVEELAGWLNRTPKHTGEIIRDMVRDGELSYTIPDMPRHPEQAYRATARSSEKA